MYLVGHCWMTEIAGAFREEDIYDDGLLMLMLPDYLKCHDWVFTEAWQVRTHDMRLIQAHMLADWYVHYGDTWSVERKKVGWAYRSMRPATQMYREFYSRSEALGLRDESKPADSVRGFSHTMLEYALDTHIARQGRVDDKFDRIKQALLRLEDDAWINREVGRLGVYGEAPDPVGTAANYLQRMLDSLEPAEITYHAGAKKFGLHMCRESIEYMGHFMDRLLATLDEDDLNQVVKAVAGAIADPSTFHYVDANFCLATPPEDT